MKILQVLNSGIHGGMETHVADLVQTLVSKGHSIHVCCTEGPSADLYQKYGAKVHIHKINFDIDPIYILKLVKIIKTNNIEIVHAHEPKAVINAIIATKLTGKKIVTHTHTPMSEWQIKSKVKKIFIWFESIFYALVVNLFSDSEIALSDSRKLVKTRDGINPNKIKVIPNAVEVNKFNITPDLKQVYRSEILKKYAIPYDAIVVGYVARLTAEKGHFVLLEAFQHLLQSNSKPSLYLLFAGGGDLETTLKAKAAELGIASNVIFTGVFDSSETIKHFSCMDIFAFPSLAEGFGIVLVEAMAAGLPIVASDLPVLKEVGGSDVRYFNMGDAKDLSLKLLDIIKMDTSTKMELVTRLKKFATVNYSMEKFVNNYLNLYESINSR